MQLTVQSVMNRSMENPDLLVIGLAAGYILAKIQAKRSGMGGMGSL